MELLLTKKNSSAVVVVVDKLPASPGLFNRAAASRAGLVVEGNPCFLLCIDTVTCDRIALFAQTTTPNNRVAFLAFVDVVVPGAGSIRISIAQDVAAGMRTLYAHGMQHRQLTSYSILMTHDWRAKVRVLVLC